MANGMIVKQRPSKLRFVVMSMAILLVGLTIPTSSLRAYTPDDPIVVAMVDRGVAFLEKASPDVYQSEYAEGYILAGYTVFKATGDKDRPIVRGALARAVKLANMVSGSNNGGLSRSIVYEASVACIFLADYDSALYRAQLTSFRDFLVRVQKRHGGFGYLDYETGDTSQMQYAALALWTLHKNGIEVPLETSEATLRFMIATQDPTGGWGYQAKVGSPQLVAQEGVTKTLSTAGLAATLIAGDTLGLYGNSGMGADEDSEIPKAFVRVDTVQKERAAKKEAGIKREDMTDTINRGVRYQTTNAFQPGARLWTYYYYYAAERYESFMEIMQGKREKSPAWYNTIVEDLRRQQETDGSWGKKVPDHSPPEVCTSFAILFLIRSTQKTIAKLNEGVLAGGYGLPTDVGAIRRVGDRIVGSETTSVESLLGMLEKNETDNLEVGLLPENLSLSKDAEIRKAQVSRLSRLISSKDPKARRIAARLLGRSEDLNQVPDLIYALTDPDPLVPALAEESLRLLSRKLTSRFVEENATSDQKASAERFWRDWYSKLRPDYVFIDR